MFGNPVSQGLTFTKVLGGLSKTLSIANQVIPLYREAKPMINNAKTILSVLKDVNKSSKTTNKNVSLNSNIKKEEVKPTIISNNNPVFFL